MSVTVVQPVHDVLMILVGSVKRQLAIQVIVSQDSLIVGHLIRYRYH